MNRIKLTVLIAALLLSSAMAQEGNRIYPVILLNAADREVWLPENGGRPLIIFYNDYRNLSDNRKTFDRLRKAGIISRERPLVCIINMAPAWFIPDSFMKALLRDDIQESPDILFLFDKRRNIEIKWRLRECDYKSVVLFSDRKNIIRFIHYGKLDSMARKRLFRTMRKFQ